MVKRLFGFFLFFITLSAPQCFAESSSQVEIFDVKQGKVVKTLEAHPSFQMKAEELLKGITGIYIKVNPIPKNGNIIKIPLEPAVLVENEWVHSYVDEIKVIFPIGEKPYLMVFDDENYPHFFNFEGNTEDLQSLIHNQ